jgi:hypothetical protein
MQTHMAMAQKPLLWVEVGAHAVRKLRGRAASDMDLSVFDKSCAGC